MNALEIIYIVGALAIGFLMGMILELFLEVQTIRELQDDNRRLRLLNADLEKKLKQTSQNVEVFEICDAASVRASTIHRSGKKILQKGIEL